MSPSRVSLSRRDAEALAKASFYHPTPEVRRALARLDAALRPSEKRRTGSRQRKASKATKRAEHNAETAAIYAEVEKRADGHCECCGAPFHPGDPPHLDHYFPRGKVRQSVEGCWLIHGLSCHRLKHAGSMDVRWLFVAHAEAHGYSEAASRARRDLATAETKAALPAAPKGGRNG